MTNEAIISAAKRQLSIDLACPVRAFDLDSNSVVEYRMNRARRLFSEEDRFFEMVSFGKGTVLSANEAILGFCASFARSDTGVRLVEREEIGELYQYEGFENALQYSTDCLRPDVLAAIMYDRGMVCGIAGASRDCDLLWQVGVYATRVTNSPSV